MVPAERRSVRFLQSEANDPSPRHSRDGAPCRREKHSDARSRFSIACLRTTAVLERGDDGRPGCCYRPVGAARFSDAASLLIGRSSHHVDSHNTAVDSRFRTRPAVPDRPWVTTSVVTNGARRSVTGLWLKRPRPGRGSFDETPAVRSRVVTLMPWVGSSDAKPRASALLGWCGVLIGALLEAPPGAPERGPRTRRLPRLRLVLLVWSASAIWGPRDAPFRCCSRLDARRCFSSFPYRTLGGFFRLASDMRDELMEERREAGGLAPMLPASPLSVGAAESATCP